MCFFTVGGWEPKAEVRLASLKSFVPVAFPTSLFIIIPVYLCVQSSLSEGRGRPHGIRARSIPVWLCFYKLCVRWSPYQVKSGDEGLGIKILRA